MARNRPRSAHLGAEEGGQEETLLPEREPKEPRRQEEILFRLVAYRQSERMEECDERRRPQVARGLFEVKRGPPTFIVDDMMAIPDVDARRRSEEHTSELQS